MVQVELRQGGKKKKEKSKVKKDADQRKESHARKVVEVPNNSEGMKVGQSKAEKKCLKAKRKEKKKEKSFLNRTIMCGKTWG